MNIKWIGTAIILLGCGGFGFRLAATHRLRVKELRDLLSVMELLSGELRYRLTPLPELCLMAAGCVQGSVGKTFRRLRDELDRQIAPDAECCMSAAVSASCLTSDTKRLLLGLGRTLGRFDLEGQLKGIGGISRETAAELDRLTKNQDARLRSYQTLGLCAGAALAILLL